MIIKRRHFVRPADKVRITANHMIRFPQLRVLDEHGEMIGIMSSAEAQQRAREENKDLVLVTEHAQPPIAKVIAISKFRYQLQQKAAESRKKSRSQDLKEIRFRTPYIGANDLQVRIKKIAEFLRKGDKVRLSLELKRRDMGKQDLARKVFDQVFAELGDLATIEIEPKMMGQKLMAQIMPFKKVTKKEEKPAAPVAPATPATKEETHATLQTENA